jgi:hypothetical protein
MLIQRGQRAAMSMPVEIALRTMQRAIWEARKARPEKKVPARAAGVKETFWMWRRSSKGFQKYWPYIWFVADVMMTPQRAVMMMVRGQVTPWPKRDAFGVLAYRVQSRIC